MDTGDDHQQSLFPDDGTWVGEGGELHQTARPGGEVLTTQPGVVIADNQNSLRAGPRGPALLQDFVLREKTFSL